MAYLACFSERHLANKITSLSAILNNILATYVMQLLLQLRMSMFSNPFQKDTWTKPRGRVEVGEGGGFSWGGVERWGERHTTVIEEQ